MKKKGENKVKGKEVATLKLGFTRDFAPFGFGGPKEEKPKHV